MQTMLTQILPKTGRGGSTRGVRIGTLIGTDGAAPLVDYAGNRLGPLEARSMVTVTRADAGREVVLLFERNNAEHPIIVGVLLDRPVQEPVVEAAPKKIDDVRVDGGRLTFEAKKEILLRCGEGSILMRADGKVIIKGIDITTRARGLNKVKGAAVKIN